MLTSYCWQVSTLRNRTVEDRRPLPFTKNARLQLSTSARMIWLCKILEIWSSLNFWTRNKRIGYNVVGSTWTDWVGMSLGHWENTRDYIGWQWRTWSIQTTERKRIGRITELWIDILPNVSLGTPTILSWSSHYRSLFISIPIKTIPILKLMMDLDHRNLRVARWKGSSARFFLDRRPKRSMTRNKDKLPRLRACMIRPMVMWQGILKGLPVLLFKSSGHYKGIMEGPTKREWPTWRHIRHWQKESWLWALSRSQYSWRLVSFSSSRFSFCDAKRTPCR